MADVYFLIACGQLEFFDEEKVIISTCTFTNVVDARKYMLLFRTIITTPSTDADVFYLRDDDSLHISIKCVE